MALEYRLTIKTRLNHHDIQKIEAIVEKHKNEKLFLCMTYTMESDYVDLTFKGNIFKEEIAHTINISIELIRSSNNLLSKKYMMHMINDIIQATTEDFYFYFNGDIIYLKRENGKLEKDETSDFWKYL